MNDGWDGVQLAQLIGSLVLVGSALLVRRMSLRQSLPMLLGWAALIVAATLGFGFYVSNFGSYNATYGSLGAVIVLLTWLNLSAFILLFGAELNAELEHQTRRDTTEGPEKPLGQRGAEMADTLGATP